MTTEESGEGEAPKSAAYHEWAMLLILAAYDNNNVSGLTALKYAGDYQRGARAGGRGATLIVRASPSNPCWLFTSPFHVVTCPPPSSTPSPSHSHCYTGIWGPSRGEKASNRRQGEHRITCGNSPLAHWSILGRCALRALWHTKQLTESSWRLCDRPGPSAVTSCFYNNNPLSRADSNSWYRLTTLGVSR